MTTIQRVEPAPAKRTTPRRIAVVPVYNEEPTVIQVLEELLPLVDEIVVVDDGSVDRSRELICEWALHNRQIHTILFDENQGLSAAYYAAFQEIAGQVRAGELGPDDLVITVDADGQHDPADLDRLTARVTEDGYDAAVARRDLSGYSFIKRLGNNSLSWWATFWAGTRLYDVESGFRVFRAGPLIESIKYYHGYRYSETVEVAVVLPRLGYSLANDVLVPVPVQRSRTSIRDGVIDALAMIGAWWRVYTGQHKPSDVPAWAMYLVPALAILGLLFVAGDMLRTPLYLASDSMHNYAHIWYLSDQIFHHANFPIHIAILDGGDAVMFPYGFAPYLMGAALYPVLGDWAVGLLMIVGLLGMVYTAGLARPVMRDPWLIILFLLNPFLIDSVLAFQFASVWCALFFFAFVWAFERQKTLPAAALLWLTVSTHPLMGTLAVGVLAAVELALHPERFRRLLTIGVPVAVALIPIYWMTLSVPSLNDSPGAFVRTTLDSIVTRGTYFAAPFVFAWISPWLRQNYRIAGLSLAGVTVAGFVLLSGIVRFEGSPGGYYGMLHTSSDTYAQYFASPQFHPGLTYRVLEPTEREDGMYRFMKHDAVLANEFFTESTMLRPWTSEQYGCYTAFKGVDVVVVEAAYEERYQFNEQQLVQSLVLQGKATLDYADPGGRFDVYNIQPFVSAQEKPSSLSQCQL